HDTRAGLDRRRREQPLSSLESLPGFDGERRSFREALAGPGLSIIAECKARSPSKGPLVDEYDPARIAESYERAGAAAVSVLTEPIHFSGRPEHLAAVRERVRLPLLRKDFIIDPWQIAEARAVGADAVLLIAAVLDRPQLSELHAAASEYGLESLVELYDARELDRIDFDRVSIAGVNSRDLRTFDVDVDEALRTLDLLPAGVLRVAESGISSASTLVRLQDRGVDAALIGEAFMTSADSGGVLERFLEALESAQSSSEPGHRGT
ncbi:MAG: indole-3-glycerol-phosphate synthase, partial [Rhodothermales bacterium]|nr:indole-3-glycerol-phosphate synthase [Rhodothermales bacterium]